MGLGLERGRLDVVGGLELGLSWFSGLVLLGFGEDG